MIVMVMLCISFISLFRDQTHLFVRINITRRTIIRDIVLLLAGLAIWCKSSYSYHMPFMFQRNLCIGVAVCLLLNTVGFLSILAVSDDDHRISFFIEHGFDHIVLSHSDDHQPFDGRFGLAAKHDEGSHEFHLTELTGVIHLQLFKSNLTSFDFSTFCPEVQISAQVFAASKLYESDIGLLDISTTVLRI
jgi:hypothetical protein